MIAEVGHDPSTRTMRVLFPNGKAYDYFHVSEEKFKELMEAESIGSHFARNIRGNLNHPFEKVDEKKSF